jgi:hypothetical protein
LAPIAKTVTLTTKFTSPRCQKLRGVAISRFNFTLEIVIPAWN